MGTGTVNDDRELALRRVAHGLGIPEVMADETDHHWSAVMSEITTSRDNARNIRRVEIRCPGCSELIEAEIVVGQPVGDPSLYHRCALTRNPDG